VIECQLILSFHIPTICETTGILYPNPNRTLETPNFTSFTTRQNCKVNVIRLRGEYSNIESTKMIKKSKLCMATTFCHLCNEFEWSNAR
jgi:hypothetical protein